MVESSWIPTLADAAGYISHTFSTGSHDFSDRELRCRWERATWILAFCLRRIVPSLSVVPRRQTLSVAKVCKGGNGCFRSH